METSTRRLALVAAAAAAIHLLAGAGSLVFLRGGSPAGPDAGERAAYVATHLAAWRVGWLLWNLAALSLVALLALLAPPTHAGRVALILAAAGLATDLTAETSLAYVLPSAGAATRATVESFGFAVEGILANALYTIALALAVLAASRAGRVPRGLALGVVPACVAGALTSVASATLDPASLFVSAGALTIAMGAWSAWLAAWAWRTRA